MVQDAEGSLSMSSTKEQDDKKCCLSPVVSEFVVSSLQSLLPRFRKVLKVHGMACRTRNSCDKALQGLLMCVLFKILSFSVVVWVE